MPKRKLILATTALAIAVAGCAGRDPIPVAVVQPFDNQKDCTALMAEANANNQRLTDLAGEQGGKVTQNVVAGVVGAVLFWPALFAMDFKGAASTEAAALQSRQQYLATLAGQRCAIAALPYGSRQ
jgi:hypothetical protein